MVMKCVVQVSVFVRKERYVGMEMEDEGCCVLYLTCINSLAYLTIYLSIYPYLLSFTYAYYSYLSNFIQQLMATSASGT